MGLVQGPDGASGQGPVRSRSRIEGSVEEAVPKPNGQDCFQFVLLIKLRMELICSAAAGMLAHKSN